MACLCIDKKCIHLQIISCKIKNHKSTEFFLKYTNSLRGQNGATHYTGTIQEMQEKSTKKSRNSSKFEK